MKRYQLVVCVGLLSFAVANGPLAQKPIVFKDSAKNPRLIVQGNEGFFVPGESFELSGNVQIKRLGPGGTNSVDTLMTCAKATGNLLKVKDKVEVDKVRMTGGVKVSQTGEATSLNASGDTATYDLNGELREVNVTGEVTITFGGKSTKDVTNKQGKKEQANVTSNWTTNSRNATLTFKTTIDEKKREVPELQTATINGPIQFNGTQLVKDSSGEKLQRVFAKANKMTYTHSGEGGKREIRLEGDLTFREIESNDDGATVEGANLLILQLNDKNVITKMRFTSSEGQQVSTTITKATRSTKKGGN